MTSLGEWANFYVIVGSSAGALIGLQFVVITLLADAPLQEGAVIAGHAFGTPNVVHFGAVLLLAALVCAPWHGMGPLASLFGAMGVIGLAYAGVIIRRFRIQNVYRPEFEDWLFHVVLPILAYAVLAASACATRSHLQLALFGVASAALLLLFIGIHNAWDAVTYHVFVQRRKQRSDEL